MSAVIACGATEPTSRAMVDENGSYRLVAVNGHSLPYGDQAALADSGTLVMDRTHQTFTETLWETYPAPSGGSLPESWSGSYARSEGSVTLHSTQHSPGNFEQMFSGTLDSCCITVVMLGTEYQFRKE